MAAETRNRTVRRELDEFFPLVRSFLERDALDLSIDARRIRGGNPLPLLAAVQPVSLE